METDTRSNATDANTPALPPQDPMSLQVPQQVFPSHSEIIDIPIPIQNSEYAQISQEYEKIPRRLQPSGQPMKASLQELPPFPENKYMKDLGEAEDLFLQYFMYTIAHQIRFENMPPIWTALIAKVKSNIRRLGGSFWLQIPNEFDDIPQHSIHHNAPLPKPQSAAVDQEPAAAVRAPTSGVESGAIVRNCPVISTVQREVELPLLRASALESERALLLDSVQGPTVQVHTVQREVELPLLRANALESERALLLDAVPASTGQAVLATVPPVIEKVNYPSDDGVVKSQSESNRQHKFPTPRRWDTTWKSEMLQRPNLIELYVRLIFTYLKNVNAYTEGDCFPMQFLFYVEDPTIMEALSAYVVSEQSIIGQNEKDLVNKTVTLVKRVITGESRDPESTARDKLLAGEVKQGTKSVSSYIEAFKAQARLLKD